MKVMVPLTCTMPICSLCREGWLRTRRPALSLDTNLRTWEKQRGDGDRERQEQRIKRRRKKRQEVQQEEKVEEAGQVDGGRLHAFYPHRACFQVHTYKQRKMRKLLELNFQQHQLDEVCFNPHPTGAWKTMEHMFRRNIHSADSRRIILLVSPLWIAKYQVFHKMMMAPTCLISVWCIICIWSNFQSRFWLLFKNITNNQSLQLE